MRHVQNVEELEKVYRTTVKVLLKPFEIPCSRKKARYRTGWTPKIERMSRNRKKLYRQMLVTGTLQDRQRHDSLDRTIKTEVRKNRMAQTRLLQQELTNIKPGEVGKVAARVLRTEGRDTLNGNPRQGAPQLIPSRFTKQMETPAFLGWTPALRHFEINEEFVHDVRKAINVAPTGKATGLDNLF